MLTRSWLALTLLLPALLVGAWILPAHAHASMVSSDPPQGAILQTPPPKVSVRFSEELERGFSGISVLDPSGRRVDRQEDATFSQDRRDMTVSLSELKEGIYIISWKALSAVDGHITEGSFQIGVGNVSLTSLPRQQAQEGRSEALFAWEVLQRWVTFTSQTALLGSVAFLILVWRPATREVGDRGLELRRMASSSFRGIPGLSLIVVGASTFTSLLLQAFIAFGWDLPDLSGFGHIHIVGAILQLPPPSEVASGDFAKLLLETRFGMIWILRMVLIGMVALSMYAHHHRGEKHEALAWLLGGTVGALFLTTSLNSHNASLGALPIVADWIHLMGVGFWIGGLLQMAATLSSLYRHDDEARNDLSELLKVLIPRFSLVGVLSIGVIGVTGLFSGVIELRGLDALFSSPYGKALIAKLLLIVPIMVLGALSQFWIHSTLLHLRIPMIAKRFLMSVRLEGGLAIMVLLVVGVLTSLPPPSTFSTQSGQGLTQTASDGDVTIKIEISPGLPGVNEFRVTLLDGRGREITDVREVILEFRPEDLSLGPSTARALSSERGGYAVVGTNLGISGAWTISVQAQRQQAYDVIARFALQVRDQIGGRREMVEFSLPDEEEASPYDLGVDGEGQVWFTIPQSSSIGRFDPRSQTFDTFKVPEPGAFPSRLAVAQDGKVWFTDPLGSRVSSFDPSTRSFRSFSTPTPRSSPDGITISRNGTVWFVEWGANKVAGLNPLSGEITEYPIPTPKSLPVSIAVADEGSVWFTEAGAGKIGRLDVVSGIITEYSPGGSQLSLPAGMAVDQKGLIWFSEHGANRLTVFNPTNGSFRGYGLRNPSGYPFGVALDREGNVWLSEHIGNAIAVLTVRDGSLSELPIPTPNSNTQWITVDRSGNVWFAEASGGKLGLYGSLPKQAPQVDASFANIALAGGVALVALAALFSYLASRRMKAGRQALTRVTPSK